MSASLLSKFLLSCIAESLRMKGQAKLSKCQMNVVVSPLDVSLIIADVKPLFRTFVQNLLQFANVLLTDGTNLDI